MRKRLMLICSLIAGVCTIGFNQQAIYLTNPSFEDYPRHSVPPKGWTDCGWAAESPPDVQPSGDFGVYREAVYGKTYLGMVVRDNETWERVSQKLSQSLRKGECYEFSLALAQSRYYISPSRQTERTTNYTTPVVIRIYGGNSDCDRAQKFDETGAIDHNDWRQYTFKLEPNANYSHIVIEAFYETPVLFPYNGNVLIDNASAIEVIPCNKPVPDEPEEIDDPIEPVIAENTTKPETPAQPDKPDNGSQPTPPVNETPTPTPPTKAKEDKVIAGVKRSEMTTGSTIQLEHVYFEADSSRIRKESVVALNELFEFMETYRDIVIEIGGHTNSYPPDEYCDRLSEARAKAVSDYLAQKGIPRSRLKFKGYGKRKPIASNDTKAGRNKNQRVEIKILEIKGG